MKENKKEVIFTCESCQAEVPLHQVHEFDGRKLCYRCLQEETTVCSVCGERIWSYDNAGTEGTPLCQQCYDRYYCCLMTGQGNGRGAPETFYQGGNQHEA